MVCLDDKHNLKVGEPGFPVAAVDQGREVVVTCNSSLQVGDHDFTKAKITPSVTLICDVPESLFIVGVSKFATRTHFFNLLTLTATLLS